jgi:hypothetical protein
MSRLIRVEDAPVKNTGKTRYNSKGEAKIETGLVEHEGHQ